MNLLKRLKYFNESHNFFSKCDQLDISKTEQINNDFLEKSKSTDFSTMQIFVDLGRLTINFRDFQRFFEFIGQFFFQNNIFKLSEIFSELGIRVLLENKLRSFQAFLILQI
jgi:hypothetical protein